MAITSTTRPVSPGSFNLIDSIRERLSAVALDGEEGAVALKAAASLGIVGVGIYDPMIAHCALKAKADITYSWNTRHYSLCGIAVTELLRTPQPTDESAQFPKRIWGRRRPL